MYKEYRKTATVKAKLFEKGDEDGFTHKYGAEGSMIPYIITLENQALKGEFCKHYLCIGIKGERWLVEKSIFEATHEAVN